MFVWSANRMPITCNEAKCGNQIAGVHCQSDLYRGQSCLTSGNAPHFDVSLSLLLKYFKFFSDVITDKQISSLRFDPEADNWLSEGSLPKSLHRGPTVRLDEPHDWRWASLSLSLWRALDDSRCSRSPYKRSPITAQTKVYSPSASSAADCGDLIRAVENLKLFNHLNDAADGLVKDA